MNSNQTTNRAAAFLMLATGLWLLYSSVAFAQKATDNENDAHGVQASTTLQRRDTRYRLSAGDVIDLSFPLSPEFNQTVTIAPDGYISLRGIGDYHASGHSVPELVSGLETAYSKILHDPVITVELKDFQKPYFTVGGEVGHPGKYDLRENTTVTEALEIAGGLIPSSKHSQVLLFRRLPGGNFVEARKLDVKKMLKSGNLEEDMYLQPGDLVYVPKNAISKIDRFLPSNSLSFYAPRVP